MQSKYKSFKKGREKEMRRVYKVKKKRNNLEKAKRWCVKCEKIQIKK